MNVFLTGTDTGCGKTYVSCALLRAAAAQGAKVVGMKPVASGALSIDGVRTNEDVLALEHASNVLPGRQWTNPYLYDPPCSPHIAAAQTGRPIDLGVIREAYKVCRHAADFVVVEGVGGWMVPLGAQLSIADLVAALELPVVLVVGIKLGCINHALLSAASINGECRLEGWIANHLDGDLYAREAVVETLRERLPAPLLGSVAQGQSGALQATVASLLAAGRGAAPDAG